jgi:trimeric autotransporter adhesin
VTYRVSAEFTGFVGVERSLTLAEPPCDQSLDFQLALESRSEATAERRTTGPRFQALNVQPGASGSAAALEVTPSEESDEVSRLLPQGFSVENVQAEAIAINGSNGLARLDRGLMDDRSQLINLGQLDPTTGQFAEGFGAPEGGFPGRGGFNGAPGGDGRGGFAGPFGRGGGPGGRGGFVLAGRGARGQRPYQGSATYTFGGSVLDSPPFQLRPDVPVDQPQFARNNFGATFGGPLRIPGIYEDTNRRTNFQVNYTGSQSNSVFDQYATVPTDAQRSGDFSAGPIQLMDPLTGQAFPGNRIPASRIDPSASALLPFIPAPNLAGTTQNYHVSTVARTTSEAFSARFTQNLSPTMPQPQGGGGGAGRGGGAGFGGRGAVGGGGGRPGGPGAPGFGSGRGTNIVLNAQVQYRHSVTESPNVFPDLGYETSNTTVSAPISLNVRRNRSIHNITFNLTHAAVDTTNAFANQENVAALAGIGYPPDVAIDPLNWGVPNLSFTDFSSARSAAATRRSDNRLTAGYAWIHPSPTHQLRMGGDFRLDRSDAAINANARGSFTFTGRYSSGGGIPHGATGADFADFLLGFPQQASLQVGGTSQLRQHGFDLFAEDNRQLNSKLTVNLGLRYELAQPYVEINQRMANLDVTPDFGEVVPVLPGAIGPFSGAFPLALLNTDANNVAPRLGFAYRVRPNTIVRGGYGITYNSGSYASIARQLSGQPPFAETETIAATDAAPLTLADALLSPLPATTNNWGVDRDYALGMIQTWNATITRNVTQDWLLQAGYTGIKGTDLDILRAPVFGTSGLIVGNQPFIWESSGGRSIMNAATLQVRRRLARGWSGGLSYAIGKAMDDASSLGAGGPVVAQNDKDLDAEWATSSFDRRHQLSGNVYVELPWGPNRHWLKDGAHSPVCSGSGRPSSR